MIGAKTTSQPLYNRLANELTRKIRNKAFPSKAFPSENQLCQEYDVSRKTVRRALEILENRGLLKTVQGKQRRITASGSMTDKAENSNICCLVSRYASNYNELCNYLTGVFKKLGYNLFFTFQDNDFNFDRDFFRSEKYAACIFIGSHMETAVGEVFKITGNIPALAIDNNNCLYRIDNIGTDEYVNAYRICQLLIDNGHRKIGLIENRGFPTITAGFKKCLEDNNIEHTPDNFLYPKYKLTDNELKSFLSAGNFTALHVSVYRAYGEIVFNYIHEHGIKVPEDLSIIGYDDVELYTKSGIVRPDAMATRWKRIAEIAVERICGKLNNHLDNDIISYRIESEIIQRGTVKNIQKN